MTRKNDTGKELFEVVLEAEASASTARIEAMTKNIKGRGDSLKHDIHVTAVSCALHAAVFGDVGPMQRLDEAMGKGMHRNGFRTWGIKHGCFGYRLADAKTGAKAGFTFDSVKAEGIKAALASDKDACIKALMATPWFDVVNEPALSGFDLVKMAKALISKAKKAQADPVRSKHPDTKIEPAFLAKLEALVERGSAAVH